MYAWAIKDLKALSKSLNKQLFYIFISKLVTILGLQTRFLEFLTLYKCTYMAATETKSFMVLILDGNSEKGAHVWSDLVSKELFV